MFGLAVGEEGRKEGEEEERRGGGVVAVATPSLCVTHWWCCSKGILMRYAMDTNFLSIILNPSRDI